MALPVVNEEVAYSLEHETNNDNWINEQIERLSKENPVIAQLIAESSEDEVLYNRYGIAYIALLVYRMLEAQMDCDELTSAY